MPDVRRVTDALRRWAPILKVLAVLWVVLAMFMAIPLLILIVEGEPDAMAFGLSIAIVLAAAALSWLVTWRVPISRVIVKSGGWQSGRIPV